VGPLKLKLQLSSNSAGDRSLKIDENLSKVAEKKISFETKLFALAFFQPFLTGPVQQLDSNP